jgi:CO/xanthine dehydrogenase Mo-binding subunit
MTGLLHEKEFSRKSFIKRGGALIVGFSLAGAGLAGKAGADAGATSAGYLPDISQVDSWLSIGSDGVAVLKTSQIEVGNGVTTGLLQVFAEELNLPMSMVRHGMWDTYQLVNSGSTGGSTGIQSSPGPAMRAAAAAGMQALLSMASTSLGVPVANLTVSNGTISGGGRSVTYAQLVGGKLFNTKIPSTANSLAPGQAPAKPVSQYTLVTTSVPRVDLPAKISGTYTYVHNVRIPGMIHGRVVRPRGQGPMGSGATIVSIDPTSISHIPNAKILQKGQFLGVVAPHEFDAIQAAAQLKVTWADSPILPGSGNLFGYMRSQVNGGQATTSTNAPVNAGNLGAGFSAAAKTLAATYSFHNGSRVPIGPACAVADVTSTSAIVYCSSQQIQSVVTGVAPLLGLPANQVRVYYYEGASSFGSAQSTSDTPKAAALLSQLAGAPVRLQLMRWDEHGWDNYQSAQLSDLRGGIDASGKLTAYQFTLMQAPYSTVIDLTSELTGSPLPALSAMSGARCDEPSCGVMYYSPNKSITGLTLPVYNGYFRAGSHRSGGEGQLAAFAAEQFMDELAYAAGMDPVAFRVQNASTPRWGGVISAAAQAAGWTPRVANSVKQSGDIVTGRGIGAGTHGTAGMAAAVAEIQVNKKTGKIQTTHIYNAIDVGLAVNPGGVENQISGGSIMGLSRILHEQVTFTKTRVTSLDWVTYPILRFAEAPKVTNIVLQQTNQLPLGAGEPGITPIPAAVANAFFDATGVRLRSGPFTPARVRAGLKAAGA